MVGDDLETFFEFGEALGFEDVVFFFLAGEVFFEVFQVTLLFTKFDTFGAIETEDLDVGVGGF